MDGESPGQSRSRWAANDRIDRSRFSRTGGRLQFFRADPAHMIQQEDPVCILTKKRKIVKKVIVFHKNRVNHF